MPGKLICVCPTNEFECARQINSRVPGELIHNVPSELLRDVPDDFIHVVPGKSSLTRS